MMAWITGLQHTHNAGGRRLHHRLRQSAAAVFGLIIYRWPVTSGMWGSIALAMFGLGFLFSTPDSHVDPANIWLIHCRLMLGDQRHAGTPHSPIMAPWLSAPSS